MKNVFTLYPTIESQLSNVFTRRPTIDLPHRFLYMALTVAEPAIPYDDVLYLTEEEFAVFNFPGCICPFLSDSETEDSFVKKVLDYVASFEERADNFLQSNWIDERIETRPVYARDAFNPVRTKAIVERLKKAAKELEMNPAELIKAASEWFRQAAESTETA